jgi:hypothetical protein
VRLSHKQGALLGLGARGGGAGRPGLGGGSEAGAGSLELFDEAVELAELVCGGVFGDGPEALDHGTEFLAFGGGQLFVESVGPEAKDVGHVGFDLHLANLARGA